MFRLLALGLALIMALPAAAHEFWLEPVDYQVSAGAKVQARALNGEEFEGVEYAYNAARYGRSRILTPGGGEVPLRGTNGDKPAVQFTPTAGEGLYVVHHSEPMQTLTYEDMERFEGFLQGKHLEAALDRHAARGLPTTDIRESYFRFVKTMVAVGNGEGADRRVGMPYELVALSNPYTESGPVRFRLLLLGKPVGAGTPVFVFRKQGGSVSKIDLRTDLAGEVAVPRSAGAYMVNAVHIDEAPARIVEQTQAHWVTLWASVTYEIGG